MGLFDMFKGESPKLTPLSGLAAALLYMMAADGEIEREEIGQLLSVVGGDEAQLQAGLKYVRAVKFEQFLQEAPPLLNDAQRLCLLINVCDSLLSDGRADAAEQKMFGELLNAMGVSEENFKPYLQTIAIKNNRGVFKSQGL